MREYRSIFVSDVHLGTPDCQAEYLLDFLRTTRSASSFAALSLQYVAMLRARSRLVA